MSAIISESDPVCSHNGFVHIEGDEFWLSCNMTFQGAWAPVMTWYRDLVTGGSGQLESAVSGTAANVTELNTRVSYTIKSTFTRTISPDYAVSFYLCVTTFPTPPSAMTSAADPNSSVNALGYQHTFTSELLVMHCKC